MKLCTSKAEVIRKRYTLGRILVLPKFMLGLDIEYDEERAAREARIEQQRLRELQFSEQLALTSNKSINVEEMSRLKAEFRFVFPCKFEVFDK